VWGIDLSSSTTPRASARLLSLVQRGAALHKKWGCSTFRYAPTDLAFGHHWANWLIPARLIVGRYPHIMDTATSVLERLLALRVDCFVSLQRELPAQGSTAWPDKEVRVADGTSTHFAPYKPLADSLTSVPLTYIHAPITNGAAPENLDALYVLFEQVLGHYENGGCTVYVHCLGGRGRSGLVGACLLLLLDPRLNATHALYHVQTGYCTRNAGHGDSPETAAQVEFVNAFARDVLAARWGPSRVLD